MWLIWIAVALLLLLAAVLVTAYVCYKKAFYSPDRKPRQDDSVELPEGAPYEPYWDTMTAWVLETRALPHEELTVRSFDGLLLRGTYYEYAPGAPIEIMFHGYRGTPERDLSGGVMRCFAVGRSCILVTQRGNGESQGNEITFGIKERKDCLSWINLAIQKFGPDVKLILTGMSMGAATVMMAAGETLPPNVVGVLADCGYTTPGEIIRGVMENMGLPSKLLYPFVRLGALLYGGFRLEETSPLKAMQRCKVPVLFFHGEKDTYVPCEMSRRNYEACVSRKRLVIIPDAEHGLSSVVGLQKYMHELKDFFGPELSYRK